MKKILYIRLDSSPCPEASDKIVVKDFNMESYFCTILGNKLLEELNYNQQMSFSGKIISNFKDAFPDIYNEIIVQWEKLFVKLLGSDNGENLHIEMNLPVTYINWLSHHDNSIFRRIGSKQISCLSFNGEYL